VAIPGRPFFKIDPMPLSIFENRLPVPSAVPARHFLYKTNPLVGVDSEISLLGDLCWKAVLGLGLSPGQIELLVESNLQDDRAEQALRVLQSALPSPLFDVDRRGIDLLVTELAMPHSDPDYEGWAFVSVVLRTGPNPYALQLLHTERNEGASENLVRTSTVLLRPGDVVVFDPTTPHLCVPTASHEDQLLVLAQFSVLDVTESDREKLVKALPPLPRIEDDPAYATILNEW